MNSNKLIKERNLIISRFTVSTNMKDQGLKYRKIKMNIQSSTKDKQNRVKLAKKWLFENQ